MSDLKKLLKSYKLEDVVDKGNFVIPLSSINSELPTNDFIRIIFPTKNEFEEYTKKECLKENWSKEKTLWDYLQSKQKKDEPNITNREIYRDMPDFLGNKVKNTFNVSGGKKFAKHWLDRELEDPKFYKMFSEQYKNLGEEFRVYDSMESYETFTKYEDAKEFANCLKFYVIEHLYIDKVRLTEEPEILAFYEQCLNYLLEKLFPGKECSWKKEETKKFEKIIFSDWYWRLKPEERKIALVVDKNFIVYTVKSDEYLIKEHNFKKMSEKNVKLLCNLSHVLNEKWVSELPVPYKKMLVKKAIESNNGTFYESKVEMELDENDFKGILR